MEHFNQHRKKLSNIPEKNPGGIHTGTKKNPEKNQRKSRIKFRRDFQEVFFETVEEVPHGLSEKPSSKS